MDKVALRINNIIVSGDTILAPMDGFSDMPFRSVCRELGSAVSYTEFVNAIDVIQKSPRVRERIRQRVSFLPEERPVAYQLFDHDPDRLLEAALVLMEFEPDWIDINLGCSDRNVAGRGAGAGLLRTPEVIGEIFRKLTACLPVPVTGKMRIGWDEDSRNYLQVAKIVQDNGGSLLAVHARTKKQGYGGQADWATIAEVCQAVSIPVIGNGDVRRAADIDRLMAVTGCQAVMIGRGAVGNPWIFKRVEREAVPREEVLRVLRLHLERSLEFYGMHGLVLFRKHASRYLSPHPLPGEVRQRLLTATDPDEFLAIVEQNL